MKKTRKIMVHVIPLIWNNQNTKINNRPVFYRRYFSSEILIVNYNLNNLESYGLFGKNIEGQTFQNGLVSVAALFRLI